MQFSSYKWFPEWLASHLLLLLRWRIKWFVLQDRSGLYIEMNSGLITFFSDAQKYQKIKMSFFPYFLLFSYPCKRNAKTICRVWFMDMIHWCQALPVNPPPSLHAQRYLLLLLLCVEPRMLHSVGRSLDVNRQQPQSYKCVGDSPAQPSRPSTRWFQQACVSSTEKITKLGDLLLYTHRTLLSF
jgi:hypothetical protein